MSRWQPDARERLTRAAMDLFEERGFAETTVPEITARAGLTTRTFFRHFADKREVLFSDEGELPALASRMIAEAPASATPMDVVTHGLDAVAAAHFDGRFEHFKRRRATIQLDASLKERELQKLSALSDAISGGFQDRGVAVLESILIAHITATVFSVSISRWLDGDGRTPLIELLHDTLATLQSIAVPSADVEARRSVAPST